MRLDQLEGLYERWGGTPDTPVSFWDPATNPNPVFPWLASLWQGQPFEIPTQALPALVLLVTDSEEFRHTGGKGAAQLKIIRYTLQAQLVAVLSPAQRGPAQAAEMVTRFYGWLDDIGTQIRGTTTDETAKILTTQEHPDGVWDATTGNASIRFGEHFSMSVPFLRQENQLLIACDILIDSEEQVFA
jgi:hypothetical protein